MAHSSHNYFDTLPYEIKVKIFSYLSSPDIINVSTIPAFQYLTDDRAVIRKISLYKTARIDDFNFLTNANRCELITSLNITGMYWVSEDQVSKAVSSLVNLKCLYAIGTKFGYDKKHFNILRSLPQLNTLALTVYLSQFGMREKIPDGVENLYLHCYCRRDTEDIINFIDRSSTVKELWIIEHSYNFFSVATLFCSNKLKLLKRVVLCMYPSPRCLDETFGNKTLIFERCEEGQYMFENIDDGKSGEVIHISENCENRSWKTYLSSLMQFPFGVADTKKLMNGAMSPSQLQYNELNLMHSKVDCHQLSQTVRSLLLNGNMKGLKKLSVNFCICKKSETVLEEIVDKCTLIEELEIWDCRQPGNQWLIANESLLCISKLRNLTKLTLNDFPVARNNGGKILTKLSIDLPNLTSLRISSITLDSTLTKGVCKALASLPLLKDLRYEQSFINLDDFFGYTCFLTGLKLERLVLKCSMSKYNEENPSLDRFLATNKQLRFLFLQIHYLDDLLYLNDIIQKYKSAWHAYFVKAIDNDAEMQPFAIDNWEMVNNMTVISVLDPFSDYFKY